VIGSNGHTRRLTIPGKKALINQRSGQVLGVVSRDYRVVTNQEAVDLAREACGIAFPGISAMEWEAKRASAPRTLSYAHIDLMHRTHVLSLFALRPLLSRLPYRLLCSSPPSNVLLDINYHLWRYLALRLQLQLRTCHLHHSPLQ
jgi:hypothetical protein